MVTNLTWLFVENLENNAERCGRECGGQGGAPAYISSAALWTCRNKRTLGLSETTASWNIPSTSQNHFQHLQNLSFLTSVIRLKKKKGCYYLFFENLPNKRPQLKDLKSKKKTKWNLWLIASYYFILKIHNY